MIMKSILISIRPQWVEKIVRGEKTIEVRKSAPKKVPFKAYIYCTKSDKYLLDSNCDGSLFCWDKKSHHYPFNFEKDFDELFNGKVIGEFICDETEELHEWELSPQGKFADFERERLENFLTAACLSEEEVVRYRENLPYYKPLYGLHISDLKIYDKPRELSEFISPLKAKKCVDYCVNGICSNLSYEELCGAIRRCEYKKITRPPQSWQYVE